MILLLALPIASGFTLKETAMNRLWLVMVAFYGFAAIQGGNGSVPAL